MITLNQVGTINKVICPVFYFTLIGVTLGGLWEIRDRCNNSSSYKAKKHLLHVCFMSDIFLISHLILIASLQGVHPHSVDVNTDIDTEIISNLTLFVTRKSSRITICIIIYLCVYACIRACT